MASGKTFGGTFKTFASAANHQEATSKDVTKWCTDAGIFGKNCNSPHLDISFTKCKTKGKRTITFKEMSPLIDELAKKYKTDKKMEEDAAKAEIKEKLTSAEPKLHGATKQVKSGAVDRLTDTSKYTGSHKERFTEDGKGKGKEGRADTPDKSGYVGNYKGSGTYEEAKK